MTHYQYQVGGSLYAQAPSYIVRQADRQLFEALRAQEFCYVFDSRQAGKSSLRVRMSYLLQMEGYCCATINMTNITGDLITSDRWYKRVAAELNRGFKLTKKVDFKVWWKENKNFTNAQRLTKFVDEILLVLIPDKIVIFIDEVDSLLNNNFPINDFFTALECCYINRESKQQYNRITFALFGVVKPLDLISNGKPTSFNFGKAIELDGFSLNDAMPLIHGFEDKVNYPEKLLEEILMWTGGQPFLTQKLCQIISSVDRSFLNNFSGCLISDLVKNLVQKHIIENWETQDEPVHLRTIRDRVLKNERQKNIELLQLYQQVLDRPIIFNGSPTQIDLLLSGLVKKKDGWIKVFNPIYQAIFDRNWLEEQLLNFQ
jgi:AAA-like domain